MTKREVLQYMKEKRREGYITHSIMLNLYEDGEDIPQEMIDLMCHKPEPRRDIVIYGSAELCDLMNRAFRDYYEAMQQRHIAEEMIKELQTIKN